MPLIARRLPFVLAGVAGLLALAGCDRHTNAPAQPDSAASNAAPASADNTAPDTSQPDKSHRGSELPALTVRDAKGRTLTLASLKGKPVLINLWATWCGPCVKELPTLDALAVQRAGSLAVVTVSQDSGAADKVATELAAHSSGHLPLWLDPDNALALHYNTGTLPTSVLYDAQGREVWRLSGGHDWTDPQTAAWLKG